MRSGVVAQKMGMTRVFTEAGEHVPVTVLRLAKCQVVAHRTKDKNGYVALQLGAGERRTNNMIKADRGYFAKAKVEPKRKLAEFRVSEDALIPVGAEITADHFIPGQFVDVCGISIGKGFAGGMKRWNFGGLRASHGVSISHRSHRLDRRPPGPGQDLQEQEDARPSRHRPGDHAQSQGGADRRRARPDPGRGRGAGRQGRLDHRARRGEEGAAEGRARSRASSGSAQRRSRQRSRGGRGARREAASPEKEGA